MSARPRRQLPVDLDLDLDLPVPDRARAGQVGVEPADQLPDRVARERETVRALRDYLAQDAAG